MFFQHTKTALNEITKKLKHCALICNILVQLFTISFLLFNLIFLSSLRIVNFLLLLISTTYFIYYLLTVSRDINSNVRKNVKSFKKVVSLVLKFIPCCLSIYTLWQAFEYLNSLSIILIILQVVCWILQAFFIAISFMMGSFISLLLTGLDADFNITTKVNSLFSKLTRREENIDPELQLLYNIEHEKKQQKVQERKDKRLAKKQEKRQAKQERKQQKIDAKAAKKKNKRVPAPIEEIATSEDN